MRVLGVGARGGKAGRGWAALGQGLAQRRGTCGGEAIGEVIGGSGDIRVRRGAGLLWARAA